MSQSKEYSAAKGGKRPLTQPQITFQWWLSHKAPLGTKLQEEPYTTTPGLFQQLLHSIVVNIIKHQVVVPAIGHNIKGIPLL